MTALIVIFTRAAARHQMTFLKNGARELLIEAAFQCNAKIYSIHSHTRSLRINRMLAVLVTALSFPVGANAQNGSFSDIIKDKSSFELLREMTYVIDSAIIRFVVQEQIDNARIDYLFQIDAPDARIVQFELVSRRSSEFGQDLLSEISTAKISNELIQRTVREIWDTISNSGICKTALSCKADEQVNSSIDQKIQEIFPEFTEPSSGEVTANNNETSSCTATESDLFNHFKEIGGVAYANSAVISVSNAVTTDVIGANPYTYRIEDISLCSALNQTLSNYEGVNDSLYDAIKASILLEVGDYCKAGSSVTGSDKAFSLTENGSLKVQLRHLECQWEFINHAFCGARACEVREYMVEGSDSRFLRSYLE